MGVSWSKEGEDEVVGEGGPLNKETLVHIFEHFDSLDDLVRVAIVNRWWASLLGSSVVPTIIKRHKLKAWYCQDSIKALKPNNSAAAPPGVEACVAWNASQKAFQHLLDSFAFPSTLKTRVPPDAESEKAFGAWTAVAAKGGEPRVVTSKAGRRCLQFVDLAGRHPVHLRTLLFPSPLPQPVTIFCVGLAFEDATFVSGINDRFEVCHAYPTLDQGDTERAPVSITAHPVGESSDSDDDPNPSCIVSGHTQPGEWHVYSAVFNVDKSEVYVDGLLEGGGTGGGVPAAAAAAAGSGGGGCYGSGGSGGESSNVGVGSLDGLIIGADHRNDFPLGSMVEGTIPGAIAELVVFGSVLPSADRARVERKLMRDHGIDPPSEERERERALHRQAHMMLMERAPGSAHKPCPLRYLTRHNDVSWSIPHPVTGDKIRPKRIGVRETAESSGWDD